MENETATDTPPFHVNPNRPQCTGILSTSENRRGSPGNYYSYSLDVPVGSALTTMNDVLRLDSKVETSREIATKNDVL